MTNKPVFIIKPAHLVAMLVGLLMWAAILSPVWASGGDDITQSNDMNNQTSGDVNVAGDAGGNAWGFSHSLGDVDINEGANCMGSEAWGTIIVSRQTNELNQWCAGLFYDLNGKHKMAAIMRCDIKSIAQHFETAADCISENTIQVQPIAAAPLPEYIKEHEDREDTHEQEIALALARTEALEKRLDSERAARRRASNAAAAQREQDRAEQYEFAQDKMAQYAEILAPPTGNE